MTFPGIRALGDLQERTLALDETTQDLLNELGESVICEPGHTLELDSLVLRFGLIEGNVMPVVMEAVPPSEPRNV